MKTILEELPFFIGQQKKTMSYILNLIRKKKKSFIILPCSLNDLALKDKRRGQVYEKVDLCTTDSMLITWYFRIKYDTKIDRVYGPDLMKDLMNNSKIKKYKVLFLSSAKRTSLKLQKKVENKKRTKFLVLRKKDSKKTEKQILKKISKIKPDILWIGIGSPKQVEIASKLKLKLKHTAIFCVGAAFDFLTEQKTQAPILIQKAGLEWLFRLISEPKRLWKRYLITIPFFLFKKLFFYLKNKSKQIILPLLTTVISFFLFYNLSSLIAEKYFFDKLFYKNSIAHGYFVNNNENSGSNSYPSLLEFDTRGIDMDNLIRFSSTEDEQEKDKIKESYQSKKYTIVVIGDSYVWGTGVKTSQRFVDKLEKKLNKIKPTQVITLGTPGDNIFDYYDKYKISKQIYPDVQMYLFILVQNDLLLNNKPKYGDSIINELTNYCESENEIYEGPANSFYDSIEKSLKNDNKNYCFYQQLIKHLPKTNSLYMSFDDFRITWDAVDKIIQPLKDEHFYTLSFEDFYQINKNKYKIGTTSESGDPLSVSYKETHPSISAHQLYADALFEEITQNPKWKFMSY